MISNLLGGDKETCLNNIQGQSVDDSDVEHKMGDLSVTTVQTLVELNFDLSKSPIAENIITVRLSDLIARNISFEMLFHFCEHFFYAHNCYPLFKLGFVTKIGFLARRFVLLNLSNEVFFSFRPNTDAEFDYVLILNARFQERKVNNFVQPVLPASPLKHFNNKNLHLD